VSCYAVPAFRNRCVLAGMSFAPYLYVGGTVRMNRPYQINPTAQIDYSICLKDGKLKFFQAGQFISLDCPIVLQNGIVILTDGTIRFCDGSVKKLTEGDSIDNS
jgi:hypothetical protein